MVSSARRAWMVCLGLLAACGAPPLPKEPPAPVPGAVGAAPAAPAALDVSRVAEPPALLLVARWKSPTKGADQALKLLGVPLSIESQIPAEARALWRLLDLDASVDVALSLDPESTDDEPKVFAAVSIPLRSFDDARAEADKEGMHLVKIRPGVLRMPAKHGDKSECDLIAAAGVAGATPARLVCGGGSRDLEALGDWLARGLPRTAPGANDLVATLRARPLKDRYLGPLHAKATALGEEARAALAAQSVTDPDLGAAPGIVLDESIQFLEDIDSMDFRASLGATPPELVMAGAVRFGGRSSWLTRVLTDVNDRAGAAPAMFWQAPRDAYSATWGRGGDPRLYDGVLRVLRKLLEVGLARAPIPPADKEAIASFVAAVPRAPAGWVSAQGFVRGPKKPAAKSARTPTEAFADMRALATGTLGWTLLGVEAPSAEYVAWAKQGVDLYARAVRLTRDFAAAFKGTKDGDRKWLELLPRVTTVSAPPGWPRGTVAFDAHVDFDSEIADVFLPRKKDAPAAAGRDGGSLPKPSGPAGAPKKPPAAKGSLTLRLAIVPDGDRTWIGFSADLDELKKRMTAAMSGAPKEGTLAAREGLSALREPGQTWGGFFSVGELLDRVLEGVTKESPEHAEEARAVLASLPNRGRTPILMVGSGTGGPAPSDTVEVRLQAGTLTDVAGMAWFLASPQGKILLKKLDVAP